MRFDGMNEPVEMALSLQRPPPKAAPRPEAPPWPRKPSHAPCRGATRPIDRHLPDFGNGTFGSALPATDT
jgi:hypothetical protein